MGGYLGTPQRTLKRRVENVELIVHRVADILNRNDPDVSFAYCFCGSVGCSLDGKSDPAKEAAERGRQKARIEYYDPEWRDFYDLWIKSLKGLRDLKLDVWDYGDRIADVGLGGTIGGKAYSIVLSADGIDIILKGGLIGAHGAIKLGDSCKKWMSKQAGKVQTAERDVGRTLRNRDLFLITSEGDD